MMLARTDVGATMTRPPPVAWCAMVVEVAGVASALLGGVSGPIYRRIAVPAKNWLWKTDREPVRYELPLGCASESGPPEK
jgi:hypothetical protein